MCLWKIILFRVSRRILSQMVVYVHFSVRELTGLMLPRKFALEQGIFWCHKDQDFLVHSML